LGQNGITVKHATRLQLLDSPGARTRSTASIAGCTSNVGSGAAGSEWDAFAGPFDLPAILALPRVCSPPPSIQPATLLRLLCVDVVCEALLPRLDRLCVTIVFWLPVGSPRPNPRPEVAGGVPGRSGSSSCTGHPDALRRLEFDDDLHRPELGTPDDGGGCGDSRLSELLENNADGLNIENKAPVSELDLP
jgi:hypothetical protein